MLTGVHIIRIQPFEIDLFHNFTPYLLSNFSNSLKDLAVLDCETIRAANTISCNRSIIKISIVPFIVVLSEK